MCGARSPKLRPPNSRLVWTVLIYILLFIGLRAPHDLYELSRMLGSQFGERANVYRGSPQNQNQESRIILKCLMYLPCLLHPLILLILNPDYRQGLKNVWNKLYCNQDQSNRNQSPQRRGADQVRYAQAPKPIIKTGKRRGGGQLIPEVQPMIAPAKPLLGQMSRKVQQPGFYGGPQQRGSMQGYNKGPAMGYNGAQPGTPYIPMEMMTVRDPLLGNSSFDTDTSPAATLPAEFEYGKFKYVDTARVEPKIAYTPTNTPPKTPQMPHFDKAPFKQPNYIDGTWILPAEQEAYRGKAFNKNSYCIDHDFIQQTSVFKINAFYSFLFYYILSCNT